MNLKARILRLAKQTGQSPHGFMLQAVEREVSREERMREFVREAMASDAAARAVAQVIYSDNTSRNATKYGFSRSAIGVNLTTRSEIGL